MSGLDTTKHRILLAAGPIFANKGFRGATVREICDAAQVNLASINYYFGDKQHLYIDTVIHARKMRAQQVPFPRWELGVPARQKLQDFIRLLLDRTMALKTAPWQIRLLMREVLHPTEACRQLVESYFRPYLDVLMAIIDEVLDAKLPDHQRIKIAFSVIGQCMYYRFAGDLTAMMIDEIGPDDEFEIDDLAEHITDFSMAALTAWRNRMPPDSLSSGSKHFTDRDS